MLSTLEVQHPIVVDYSVPALANVVLVDLWLPLLFEIRRGSLVDSVHVLVQAIFLLRLVFEAQISILTQILFIVDSCVRIRVIFLMDIRCPKFIAVHSFVQATFSLVLLFIHFYYF